VQFENVTLLWYYFATYTAQRGGFFFGNGDVDYLIAKNKIRKK
jgi:hypothetical protein